MSGGLCGAVPEPRSRFQGNLLVHGLVQVHYHHIQHRQHCFTLYVLGLMSRA